MKITDAILQLKQAFDEQDGKVVEMVLDKKGIEALSKERPETPCFCSHCGHERFPAGNKMNWVKFLGIKIKKANE